MPWLFLMLKFVDQVPDKELPIRFSKRQETICSKISKSFIEKHLYQKYLNVLTFLDICAPY